MLAGPRASDCSLLHTRTFHARSSPAVWYAVVVRLDDCIPALSASESNRALPSRFPRARHQRQEGPFSIPLEVRTWILGDSNG